MKKIISVIITAAMLFSLTTAFAAEKTNREIILFYNPFGTLVYAKLIKAGENISIPKAYEDTIKKVYSVDTQTFRNWGEVLDTSAAE